MIGWRSRGATCGCRRNAGAPEASATDCPPEEMNAEDPLVHPVHLRLHRQSRRACCTRPAVTSLYASMTHQYVFDYHDGDIYWCTADVGWVTGHTYIVYGPLANGATTSCSRACRITRHLAASGRSVDKHQVNIFYTAPTAIRALMGAGDEPVKRPPQRIAAPAGLGRRTDQPGSLGMVPQRGRRRRCPIVDTWWQTETGGILITPLPGRHPLKPGSATRPFFGVKPVLVDDDGQGNRRLEGATEGNLVINDSWPGQMRTVYGDHQRFVETYFSTYPGTLLHRGRLPPRRGRLLLDHRPRRRRAQRFRPPHGHRRGRKRAGRAPGGRRGRRGRLSARHQGSGHLLPTSP